MRRSPVFLNLQGKKAVVFGAGRVAFRKIKDLLKSGAKVEVTSRDFSPSIMKLAKKNFRLRLKSNLSLTALLKGADLAFVATSDASLNQQFALCCRQKKILVNVVDHPELCDFFVPSFMKKGKLELAISTGGASPLLAKKFREELAKRIRPEAIRLLDRMSQLRRKAKLEIANHKKRRDFFGKQIHADFHFLSERKNSR